MDFITILSLTIFGATVLTIVMALVSYAAFQLREMRGLRSGRGSLEHGSGTSLPEGENLFFKKFTLAPEDPLERDF